MFCFFFLSFFSFSYFYPVVAYHGTEDCQTMSGEYVSEHTVIQKPIGNCVIITDCQFVKISSTYDNGGAVLFTSDALNSSFFCESTVFSECTSDLRGGAIYTRVMSTRIIQNCVVACSALIEGQFAYLKQANALAEINESSICNCKTTSGETTINIDMPAAIVTRMNCTGNEVKGSAGFGLTSECVYVTECEFVGCSGDSILRMSANCNLSDIAIANVYGNKCEDGVVTFRGNWALLSFIFIDNGDKLFVPESANSHLTVGNSVFDVTKVDIDQVTYVSCDFETIASTHEFCHINTQLCPAVHTCSGFSPVPSEPSEQAPWSRKEVVGTLVGGMIGCMIIGVLLGIFVFSCQKKRNEIGRVAISEEKLLND